MSFEEELEKSYLDLKLKSMVTEYEELVAESDEILRADKRALDALIKSKVDLPKIREGIDWYNKKIVEAGRLEQKLEFKDVWLEHRQSYTTDRIIEGHNYCTYVVMITSNWSEFGEKDPGSRYYQFNHMHDRAKVQLTFTRKMLQEDMVLYQQGFDFSHEYISSDENELVISLSEFWKTYKQWLIDHADGKDYN